LRDVRPTFEKHGMRVKFRIWRLDTFVSPAETVEPIEMAFGVNTRVVPRNQDDTR